MPGLAIMQVSMRGFSLDPFSQFFFHPRNSVIDFYDSRPIQEEYSVSEVYVINRLNRILELR
jgi:hypothetical protein